jgi:hypothetical protein
MAVCTRSIADGPSIPERVSRGGVSISVEGSVHEEVQHRAQSRKNN